MHSHADFIDLFSNVKRINILWKPFGPRDSRRDLLRTERSSTFTSGDSLPTSQRPVASNIVRVEKLWIVSNKSEDEVDDTLDTIHQLQCLFLQFDFPHLQDIWLQLYRSLSIDDLTSHWIPQRVSFPSLKEIQFGFGFTVGNVHSMDLCVSILRKIAFREVELTSLHQAAATHLLRLIDTTDTVSSIDVRALTLEIPAAPVRSIVWRYGEPAEAPFEDIRLLPGIIPTTAQRLAFLSAVKADHPNLHRFSVYAALEMTNGSRCRGDYYRECWDFCFPSYHHSGEEMARERLGYDYETYEDDDDPIYSYRSDFDPPQVEDYVFDPVQEIFEGLENPTASLRVWRRAIRNAELIHRDTSMYIFRPPSHDLDVTWEEEDMLRDEWEWL